MRLPLQRGWVLGLLASGVLVTTGAGAREHDRDEPRSERPEHDHGERHHGGDGGLGAVSPNAPGAEADDDEDDDGGAASVPVERTPEQVEYRRKVVQAEHARLDDFARGRHKLTPQDRQAIGTHWRHVMRLLRIRELAEADKNADIVKRCDALLERENKKFGAHLGAEATAQAGDGGTR